MGCATIAPARSVKCKCYLVILPRNLRCILSSRVRVTPRRVQDIATKVTEVVSTKAFGTRKNTHSNMTGRVIFDMYGVIQHDYKLSSYKLNDVSEHPEREKGRRAVLPFPFRIRLE